MSPIPVPKSQLSNRELDSFQHSLREGISIQLYFSLSRRRRRRMQAPRRHGSMVFDIIPNWCRQPRSRTSRPPLREGSLTAFSRNKDRSSSSAAISLDQDSDDPVSGHSEELLEASPFPCSLSWLGPQEEVLLKSIITEVKSVPINVTDRSAKNRNPSRCSSDHVSARSSEVSLPYTPANCKVLSVRVADAWSTPGSVVWAKTLHLDWWPAEVADEKVVRGCIGTQGAGHVLVQLFGNHQHVWLDPGEHLSEFDYCYEERSKNPSTAFQDALKQAMYKHVHKIPRKLPVRCSGELKSSTQNDRSLDGRKDNYDEEGRGKRKRKLKLHFDDLSPITPLKKLRRLRIMRHLALAAPVGSPFTRSHGRIA